MVYFSIMKPFLLLSCLLFIAAHAWSQQKNDPNTVLRMQQYLDSVKHKNEAALKAPLDLLKKKQTVVMKDQLRPKLIMPSYVNKNVMPVLSPDSNYVYNMPGTHAFDKTKVRGGVIFVADKSKFPALTEEKK